MKLKDNPDVQELVAKEVEKALATAAAALKRTVKDIIKDIKELGATHAADAKAAGNKDGADRLKALTGDLAAGLKADHLS